MRECRIPSDGLVLGVVELTSRIEANVIAGVVMLVALNASSFSTKGEVHCVLSSYGLLQPGPILVSGSRFNRRVEVGGLIDGL